MRMKPIQVATAVVFNKQKQVLMALRPAHIHQGGLWEFPGGKIKPNETIPEALAREVKEEVDLTVLSSEPLIEVHHSYPKLDVVLNVWQVIEFEGEAKGMEGQEVMWVDIKDIVNYELPAANYKIVEALKI